MKHEWTIAPGRKYLQLDGFAISYADNDSPEGVCMDGPETALIIENGEDRETYLILNGDWTNEYDTIAVGGLEACKAFYESKAAEHRSKWSEDQIYTPTKAEAIEIIQKGLGITAH